MTRPDRDEKALYERLVDAFSECGVDAHVPSVQALIVAAAVSNPPRVRDLYQNDAYFHQWVDAHAVEWRWLAARAATRYGRHHQQYDDTIDVLAESAAALITQAAIAAVETEQRRRDTLDAWAGMALIAEALGGD